MATLADVVVQGDRAASLRAIRDRLAAEADDNRWQKHKRECSCHCGMGDGRTLVAILKELRAVESELQSLPDPGRESKNDDLAAKRKARRAAVATNSQPA